MKERKRLCNLAETWESYRKLRNETAKEVDAAHANYQSLLFNDDSNNTSKRLWKHIKVLEEIMLEYQH